MSTADQRVQRQHQKYVRYHTATRLFGGLALLTVPLVVFAMEWPLNLIAALPLGVVGLYLFFYTR